MPGISSLVEFVVSWGVLVTYSEGAVKLPAKNKLFVTLVCFKWKSSYSALEWLYNYAGFRGEYLFFGVFGTGNEMSFLNRSASISIGNRMNATAINDLHYKWYLKFSQNCTDLKASAS